MKTYDRIVEKRGDPSYAEDATKQKLFKRDLERIKDQMNIADQLLKSYQDELYSIRIATEKDLKMEAKYTDLKTREGKITLSMIVLLSVSVIWMVLTSTLSKFPLIKDILQQNTFDSLIPSLMFTAGIVLLIVRVYLHGREA